jgi:pimeloyl-ACP methyl ester carboxylesterase
VSDAGGRAACTVATSRERLKKGEMASDVGVRTARTIDVAKMMKASGYDWLFTDLEYGQMSIEFTARAFSPLGNTRREKRLSLMHTPTLLIWGVEGRVMPKSYADRFARAIAGRSEIQTIPGAGQLADLAKPADVPPRSCGERLSAVRQC